MSSERTAQLRARAALLDQQVRTWIKQVPAKARILLGLFLVAAILMAVHTALTAKDASLHLKLQHSFRSAQLSVWVDDEMSYSGHITGATKKKFGVIPTDAQQGSLSQIIPVRSGTHKVRVRIEPEDAAMQEDSITGDFAGNTERTLSVTARRNGVSIAWQGSSAAPAEASSGFTWLSRYAASLFLTITGSIMSALAGYAIRELPARLRSDPDSAPKAQ
ncbi:MAG TPA: hypothetical protein VFA67_15595 [Candidatus Sulfotelmatobacter sp.]|nr:hypothetical protein [Candidatus Sulfotelmatobacter sp.]